MVFFDKIYLHLHGLQRNGKAKYIMIMQSEDKALLAMYQLLLNFMEL